jgi:phospholipase C
MISKYLRILTSLVTAVTLTVTIPTSGWSRPNSEADEYDTKTPIKHVIVIYGENETFDHYFATYPYAANPQGEPEFHPADGTPRVNNLLTGGLLTDNPNSVQPFRLDRSQAVTCDQNHSYLPEQEAVDHGLVDNYVAATGSGNTTTQTASTLFYGPGSAPAIVTGDILLPGQYNKNVVSGGNSTTGPFSYSGYCFDAGATFNKPNPGIVMGYFDGNTVTALWNYAQHFAMSDNSWSTTFGPSAPGAINLVAGTTAGATMVPLRPNGKASSPSGLIFGGQAGATTGALIGDARPAYDDCVNSNGQLFNTNQVSLSGLNVGDLLGDSGHTGKGITWGWFMGGFGPTTAYNPPSVPYAICGSAGTGIAGFGNGPLPDNYTTVGDYIPHHEPFEFYESSTNPHHLPPSKLDAIGKQDQANHQYDISLFYYALAHHELPAVSFLKAPAYADAHPAYSDPLDEQAFVVGVVNGVMASDDWKSTAIIIAYDDSDGWYDHTMDPVVNQSGPTPAVPVDNDDALSEQNTMVTPATGACGVTPTTGPIANLGGLCGYGQRQPLLVISPWAKTNYVDHRITDQSSILRFIEDNWDLGRIGGPSSDYKAGTLDGLFDFNQDQNGFGFGRNSSRVLLLNPSTGEPVDIR